MKTLGSLIWVFTVCPPDLTENLGSVVFIVVFVSSVSVTGSIVGSVQCRITSLCTRTSTEKTTTVISCVSTLHLLFLTLYWSIGEL